LAFVDDKAMEMLSHKLVAFDYVRFKGILKV